MQPRLRPEYWNEKNLDVWRKRTKELIDIATSLPIVYEELIREKEKGKKGSLGKLEKQQKALCIWLARIVYDATTDD